MQRLHRLRRRPLAAWLTLGVALPLVVAIRLALWSLPFAALRRGLLGLARAPRRQLGPVAPPEAIVWAVSVASLCMPRATCLTQGLAAELLLQRAGYAPELRIGVARGADGKLDAHAWVELDGRPVLGGSRRALARYTVLPSLERNGA